MNVRQDIVDGILIWDDVEKSSLLFDVRIRHYEIFFEIIELLSQFEIFTEQTQSLLVEKHIFVFHILDDCFQIMNDFLVLGEYIISVRVKLFHFAVQINIVD